MKNHPNDPIREVLKYAEESGRAIKNPGQERMPGA